MTILITGATGLVGSRLLNRMIAAGLDCRAIIRPGKTLPEGAIAVEADLLDPATLDQAVDGITAVVHLAAVFRTTDTDAIWKANVEGTRNLIAAVKRGAPNARFIMASTSLVYNADSTHPGLESDALAPEQAYPASKVVAEEALRDSGLNWSILRFPFVYGDQDGHIEALPKIMEMFQWHPATRLSIVHHRDIHTAVDLALAGEFDGRIVNITDDSCMSIYEMIKLIDGPVSPSSAPLSNPWFGQADGKLARELGFRPVIATLHQAVREGAL